MSGGFENIEEIGRLEPIEGEQIGVSTVLSPDEGYETALLDRNHAYPVERYSSKEEAEKGHQKWVEFSKNADGKEITGLGGLDGLVEEKKVILKK